MSPSKASLSMQNSCDFEVVSAFLFHLFNFFAAPFCANVDEKTLRLVWRRTCVPSDCEVAMESLFFRRKGVFVAPTKD